MYTEKQYYRALRLAEKIKEKENWGEVEVSVSNLSVHYNLQVNAECGWQVASDELLARHGYFPEMF